MKKILFVCTGNTCRSPMAEGIFNFIVSENSLLMGSFQAMSAGIQALDGDLASEDAVSVLKNKFNISIQNHRARAISEEQVRDAYLVLTMTQGHKNHMRTQLPVVHQDKIFTLKEFVSDDDFSDEYNHDISDPFGKPYEEYLKCANEIEKLLNLLVTKLQDSKLAGAEAKNFDFTVEITIKYALGSEEFVSDR